MNPSEVLSWVATATSEDHLLEQLAEGLAVRAGVDGCDLFLAEPSGHLVLRASTVSPDYIRRCRLGKGIGLCGKTYAQGKSIYLPDRAYEHPDNVAYPGIDDKAYEAMAVLPLKTAGRILGVCLLYRQSSWTLDETKQHEIESAVSLAGQALGAYDNAYRLGAHSSTLGAVSEVARTISSSPYLEEILQLLVNLTAQQFGYEVCTVRLLDSRRGELVLRAVHAAAKAYLRKPAIKLGQSIAGRAIAENQPVIIPDVQIEPDYIGHDLAVEHGLRSMICIPLTVQDRTVGVMSCYTKEVREFSQEEVSALETIAKQAAFAIEHAKLQVRTTLMQEMHHRVKNNLQQVASLLRLQMHHGQAKSLEEALSDSLTRVLAISAVHELLSREDLDLVGMKSLTESLVQLQRDSLIRPGIRVDFEVRGQDVHLNTTQGTQVALILNELIQNAVEHGFRDAREGEIHVTIEEKGNEIGLWVSNSGDKLPEGFDPAKRGNLGLKIVDNLAKGLSGKFTLKEVLGWTVAEVKFTRASGE